MYNVHYLQDPAQQQLRIKQEKSSVYNERVSLCFDPTTTRSHLLWRPASLTASLQSTLKLHGDYRYTQYTLSRSDARVRC